MDYKRQLGHRIYTRAQFRALLKQHRGLHTVGDAAGDAIESLPTETDSSCHQGSMQTAQLPFTPLRRGEVCEQAELL